MPIIRVAQRQVETMETSAPGAMNRDEWISGTQSSVRSVIRTGAAYL